jgi:2-keto-3-deoxy-L-rhamnonate aldolase RhmA
MELMVIENSLENAIFFESCGVDRIFVDLEIIGKKERQGHLDTVISNHRIEDIHTLKKNLKTSKVLVRINPINAKSKDEIRQCIDSGADIIMLPMFKTAQEVDLFLKYVNGEALTNLLFETPQSVIRIDEIIEIGGINEAHIGLNDLRIAFGLDFMMEMYLGSLLEGLSKKILRRNISLGIGGIAPIEEGDVQGKLIAAEAFSLGSERFILSRAFQKHDRFKFKEDVQALRRFVAELNFWNQDQFIENKSCLCRKILRVREKIVKIHEP